MKPAVTQNPRERGVVLVLVLGLVALIATWASNAAYEDMISLRRAENMQDALRAGQASISALVLAEKLLVDDATNTTTDDLTEMWAQPAPPFPIDDGEVSGEIIDANRLFNVNALVDAQGKVQPLELDTFRRLLTNIELDPALADAILDWLDEDQTPSGPAGAEDASYYDCDYHVRNQRIDSIDELLLVKGMDADKLAELRSVAGAWPLSGTNTTSLVNLNTAGTELLMAIFPLLTAPDAETFVDSRPYADVGSALAQPWAKGVDPARLSVASDHFIVRTKAVFGRAVVQEEYVLARQGKTLQTLARRHP